MSSEHTVEITDQNYQKDVLESSRPVVLDFWADWCMPCRMIESAIVELAEEYGKKITVGMINTDENREISMLSDVSAIPTIAIYHQGQMVKKFVGLQQKQDIKAAIDEVLAM